MKMVRRVSSLALALVIVLSLSVPAFAATSSVTYSGKGVFGFKPGSEFTRTDLFDNFKGVMPGDKLTETITIQNKAKSCDFIKVYMRAEVHDEVKNPLSPKVDETESVASMSDFLSQLSMTVWKKGSEAAIYHASPDELDGLKKNVYLGKFRRGESTTLDVELTVPLTLGNAYANRVGEVDWVFVVEEYDDERPDTPKTGDDTNIAPYVAILAVGLAGMFFLLISKRRKHQA